MPVGLSNHVSVNSGRPVASVADDKGGIKAQRREDEQKEAEEKREMYLLMADSIKSLAATQKTLVDTQKSLVDTHKSLVASQKRRHDSNEYCQVQKELQNSRKERRMLKRELKGATDDDEKHDIDEQISILSDSIATFTARKNALENKMNENHDTSIRVGEK